MGTDIHFKIVKADGSDMQNLEFNGRNYEWFDNLQSNHDTIYATLDRKRGIPEKSPKELLHDYENSYDYGYYGFNYLTVKEFIDWFDDMRPDIDAGWITKYDSWLYSNKGIYPSEIYRYLGDIDLNRERDCIFITLENKYDCNKWLKNELENRLKNSQIKEEDFVVFYFDH